MSIPWAITSGRPGQLGNALVPVNRVGITGHAGVVHQVAAGQSGVVHRQLIADLHVVERRRPRRPGAVVGDADLALGADLLLVLAIRSRDVEDVHVVHHRVLHGRLDTRVDVLGGDADDGGVQGVHPLADGIGERVGDGDEISAGSPAHRRQLHVDGQFVAGHDRAVLLEDLFGL